MGEKKYPGESWKKCGETFLRGGGGGSKDRQLNGGGKRNNSLMCKKKKKDRSTYENTTDMKKGELYGDLQMKGNNVRCFCLEPRGKRGEARKRDGA